MTEELAAMRKAVEFEHSLHHRNGHDSPDSCTAAVCGAWRAVERALKVLR